MVLLSGVGGGGKQPFSMIQIYSFSPRPMCLVTPLCGASPLMKLFVFPNERFSSHLERRKPARPEWEASSISGVTIRSIMSVSTVKVGTTMKSMNPETKSRVVEFIHHLVGLRNRTAERNPEYLWCFKKKKKTPLNEVLLSLN